MIIKCSKCNGDIERTNEIKNAVCYDCKRNRVKVYYKKYSRDHAEELSTKRKAAWQTKKKELAIIRATSVGKNV